MLAAGPAHALRDGEARAELEVLRQRLNQIESSLQVRQMGLGEQIQLIREDMARIESKIDENEHIDKLLQERLDVMGIETGDNFSQINDNLEKRLKVVDDNAGRLAKAFDEVQKNIQTLSENLQAISDFEKKQEERIDEWSTQVQQNLDVIVDEVGKENLRLKKEISGYRSDIQTFQKSVSILDTRIQSLAGEIQEISRLQQNAASASVVRGHHVVQPGDSLTSIARRYGVTVESIMSANGLADADLIDVGQALVIPGR